MYTDKPIIIVSGFYAWIIAGIFFLQLGFFTYYSVSTGEINSTGPVPIDSMFIYRPDRRSEIWRFLFYMMLHAGLVFSFLSNYIL